jgi:hypothetical protein
MGLRDLPVVENEEWNTDDWLCPKQVSVYQPS